jgi:folate-binding protein YgfZ
VAGPDAVSYLQGQLSADVAALGVDETVWSLLLDPSGKCVAWLGVERVDDHEVLLDVDAGWADAVVARLTRFLLRTKAAVEVAHRGDAGPPDVGAEAERITAGIPAMGAEITPDTIPAELGQWLIDASVSFTKGCYTGQELVARVDARGGNVAHHLRVLVFADDAPVPAVGQPVGHDGAQVGSITSAAPVDGGAVALTFIHRNALHATQVEVGGIQARVVVPDPGGTRGG